MNTKVKLAVAASIAVSGFGLFASSASAAPAHSLDPAVATSADVHKGIQEARWICRPWGCHWAPGWGYYHRPWGYGYGYGWHRGWHHGWHRGWGGGWHRHWHHW